MTSRQLHLNAFPMNTGHHEAAWRLPESDPYAHVELDHYVRLARIAERGTFDSLFLADGPQLWGKESHSIEGDASHYTSVAARQEAVSVAAWARPAPARPDSGRPPTRLEHFRALARRTDGRFARGPFRVSGHALPVSCC